VQRFLQGVRPYGNHELGVAIVGAYVKFMIAEASCWGDKDEGLTEIIGLVGAVVHAMLLTGAEWPIIRSLRLFGFSEVRHAR
jgi:hypothetical protein